MEKLRGRMQLLFELVEFLAKNGFNWANNNTVKMYNDMSEHDRKVGTM